MEVDHGLPRDHRGGHRRLAWHHPTQRRGPPNGCRPRLHHRRLRGGPRHPSLRRRAVELRGGAAGGEGMTALADLGLVEAADAVARREVTSAALLEACLARLDLVNKTVNATIWVDRERARAAAAAADAALAAGRPLGRLHGIPLAHKDMYYQAGLPCTCGSAIRRDFVPDITCTPVQRLSEAGAYTFAGLNMAEFAQNPTGHN